MIKVDLKDISKLEKQLGKFASKAIPYASQNTINQGAFDTQKNAKELVRDEMIQRNKFTLQSIRVDKAASVNDVAIVGSTANYMATQEFGDTKKAKPIATGYSAGQEGQSQRTKLPRKANTMQAIKLKHSSIKAKSRIQRNFMAIHSGAKFVFLDLGKRKGIFRVVGTKTKSAIKMVHDMTRKSVVIKKNPWLYPSVQKTKPKMEEFYVKSLQYQIDRLGIFK